MFGPTQSNRAGLRPAGAIDLLPAAMGWARRATFEKSRDTPSVHPPFTHRARVRLRLWCPFACVSPGFLTARRKVEVSLRTVTSGDAVPLTTQTPVSVKAQPWASRGGATLFFVAASRSRGLDQRLSQPVAAAVRRAAAASMDPPDAPQPLPSARSKFDAVPHAQPSGASFCALRRHISSRLHSRIRLRRSIMPPSTLPPSARRCARACKVLP